MSARFEHCQFLCDLGNLHPQLEARGKEGYHVVGLVGIQIPVGPALVGGRIIPGQQQVAPGVFVVMERELEDGSPVERMPDIGKMVAEQARGMRLVPDGEPD